LSLDRIFKALLKLELSKTDAQVYIYLATKGPAKASVISYNLKMNKQQIYRSLKTLKVKKIIKSNLEHPAIFTAVSFEKTLQTLIRIMENNAEKIEEKKNEYLSLWNLNMKN
jgi:sugar-specific transcriptional regulator TrmB